MTDLFDQLPAPLQPPTNAASARAPGGRRLSANGRPIGRPPGARNKGSMDLGRYIEAQFGGMTPGQQLAELTLVKPAEIRRARADAKELGLVDLDVPPLMLARVVKATRLARALGIDKGDAWLMLDAAMAKLLPYVHQAQPPAKPKDATALPTMFVVAQQDLDQAALGAPGGETEIIEGFDLPADEVGQPKSDGPA